MEMDPLKWYYVDGCGYKGCECEALTRGGMASVRMMAKYQNQIAAVVFMVYDY
jgi:hypothetical protein